MADIRQHFWATPQGSLMTTTSQSPVDADRIDTLIIMYTALHTAPEGEAPLPNEGKPILIVNAITEIENEDGDRKSVV